MSYKHRCLNCSHCGRYEVEDSGTKMIKTKKVTDMFGEDATLWFCCQMCMTLFKHHNKISVLSKDIYEHCRKFDLPEYR